MAVKTKIQLKAKIDAFIKTNGGKEITANVLNDVLTDFIDSLGLVSEEVSDFYIIKRSSGPDGHRFKYTFGDDGMMILPGEDLGV